MRERQLATLATGSRLMANCSRCRTGCLSFVGSKRHPSWRPGRGGGEGGGGLLGNSWLGKIVAAALLKVIVPFAIHCSQWRWANAESPMMGNSAIASERVGRHGAREREWGSRVWGVRGGKARGCGPWVPPGTLGRLLLGTLSLCARVSLWSLGASPRSAA